MNGLTKGANWRPRSSKPTSTYHQKTARIDIPGVLALPTALHRVAEAAMSRDGSASRRRPIEFAPQPRRVVDAAVAAAKAAPPSTAKAEALAAERRAFRPWGTSRSE